jgi:hypothetical protein
MPYNKTFNYFVNYDPNKTDDELSNFYTLFKNETGLPFDIMIDDWRSYKHYNHHLWLYIVINNNVFLPVTISKKPEIIGDYAKYNLKSEDIKSLKTFIKQNVEALKNVADEGAYITDACTHAKFYRQMKPLSNDNHDYMHLYYGYPASEETFLYDSVLPKDSGLPFTIKIDEGFAYKICDHPFWLFIVAPNYIHIPVTIGENPEVLGEYKKYGITDNDIQLTKNFILLNLDGLRKANKVRFSENIHHLQETVTIQLSNLILEMAKLYPEDTGVSLVIWIDPVDQHNSQHAPRIKCGLGDGISNSNAFFPISIGDNPKVEAEPPVQIPEHKINLVKHFIKLNKDILLKWWNNDISSVEVKKSITVFDRKGKPVPPKPPYKIVGKEVNGYRIIQNQNGSYNIIDRNDKIVFPNHAFTKVWDFINYGGHLCGTGQIGDDFYHLTPEGNVNLLK